MSNHHLTQIGARSEASRPKSVLPQHYRGEYKTAQARATIDAAQNDTVGLFPAPSNAVLSQKISLLAFTALGVGVTGSVGFAPRNDIGFAGAATALAATIAMANAGSASLTAALGVADLGKQVWELAGLATDPGVDLWVELKLEGANPASGTIGVEQGFVTQ